MAITGTAGNATKARLALRIPQTIQQQPTAAKDDFLKNVKFKKNVPADSSTSQPAKPALPPLPRRTGSTSEGQGTSTMQTNSPLSISQPPLPMEPR